MQHRVVQHAGREYISRRRSSSRHTSELRFGCCTGDVTLARHAVPRSPNLLAQTGPALQTRPIAPASAGKRNACMQPAGGHARLAWNETHAASAALVHGGTRERRTLSRALRVFHMRLKPSRSWSTPLQRMWKLSLRPGGCICKEPGAATRCKPLPLAGDNELGVGGWCPARNAVAARLGCLR